MNGRTRFFLFLIFSKFLRAGNCSGFTMSEAFDKAVLQATCVLECFDGKLCPTDCTRTLREVRELDEEAGANASLICRSSSYLVLAHNPGLFVITGHRKSSENYNDGHYIAISTDVEVKLDQLLPGESYQWRFYRVSSRGISRPETTEWMRTMPSTEVTSHPDFSCRREKGHDDITNDFALVGSKKFRASFGALPVDALYEVSPRVLHSPEVLHRQEKRGIEEISTTSSTTISPPSVLFTEDWVPGAVSNLMAPVDEITGYSVYLTWSAPTLNKDFVLYYNVTSCYNDHCTEALVVEEYYNVINLDACLNYTFTVNAVGNAGSSDGVSTTVSTSYVAPEEPTSIATIPGQYSLFISWQPPLIGGACTGMYRITTPDNSINETTADTNITISNLIACMEYAIKITPVSVTGSENISGIALGTTEESVADPPLLGNEELNVTKRTISIVWLIDRTTNKCGLKTILALCNAKPIDGHGSEIIGGISEDDISGFGSLTNVTLEVTVADLNPSTWYKCFGVIHNVAGVSEVSTIVTARTLADELAAVKGLTATVTHKGNDTFDIYVAWDRPELTPDFYIVNITSDYGSKISTSVFQNVSGSANKTFFSNVKCFGDFNVSIRPWSSYGGGTEISEIFSNGWTAGRLLRKTSLIVVILYLTCTTLVIIGLGIAVYWYYRLRKRMIGQNSQVVDEHEISPERLLITRVLGNGAFGLVKLGTLRDNQGNLTTVAVKMLRDDSNENDQRSLRLEIKLMKTLDKHPNIVSLVGYRTIGPYPFLVVEYCARGDLQSFLRKSMMEATDSTDENKKRVKSIRMFPKRQTVLPKTSRGSSASQNGGDYIRMSSIVEDQDTDCHVDVVTVMDMLNFGRQIATGMEFLSSNRVVHRDLATRNVLVCYDKVVKISDFGLSRDVYEENIYKKTGIGRMPLKWMAIESLTHQVYSTYSDVWAFGVLLWEIVTLGGVPYPGIPTIEILKRLQSGYRMERPENCSISLYNVMLSCWRSKPKDRPNFTILRQKLDQLISVTAENAYVDLADVPEEIPLGLC